ncbi:hypothetical protein V8C37DRAFT_391980 [Trichoderma ceciliae]
MCRETKISISGLGRCDALCRSSQGTCMYMYLYMDAVVSRLFFLLCFFFFLWPSAIGWGSAPRRYRRSSEKPPICRTKKQLEAGSRRQSLDKLLQWKVVQQTTCTCTMLEMGLPVHVSTGSNKAAILTCPSWSRGMKTLSMDTHGLTQVVAVVRNPESILCTEYGYTGCHYSLFSLRALPSPSWAANKIWHTVSAPPLVASTMMILLCFSSPSALWPTILQPTYLS